MKAKLICGAFVFVTIALSSAFTMGARSSSRFAFVPPETCHEQTRHCVREMQGQITTIRNAVKRKKPGDSVAFNPQPDPPGDPDPWWRPAIDAYQKLREELSDLSANAPDSCRTTCRNQITSSQEKLDRLSQSTDKRSMNVALADLSTSIQRLSRSLARSPR